MMGQTENIYRAGMGREERQNVYSIFGLCEPVDGVGGPIIECAPGQRK